MIKKIVEYCKIAWYKLKDKILELIERFEYWLWKE